MSGRKDPATRIVAKASRVLSAVITTPAKYVNSNATNPPKKPDSSPGNSFRGGVGIKRELKIPRHRRLYVGGTSTFSYSSTH
jgi:hypothetical protein